LLSVELAILEPWIRDALALREGRVLTPSAPTELAVITWSFMLAIFAMLFLIAKMFFFGGLRMPQMLQRLQPVARDGRAGADAQLIEPRREAPSRAFVVAEAVAQNLRREERSSDYSRTIERLGNDRSGARPAVAGQSRTTQEPLGSSYRENESRRFRRTSAASANRDSKA
jgi:type IV secretion system protein VirB6